LHSTVCNIVNANDQVTIQLSNALIYTAEGSDGSNIKTKLQQAILHKKLSYKPLLRLSLFTNRNIKHPEFLNIKKNSTSNFREINIILAATNKAVIVIRFYIPLTTVNFNSAAL